MPPFSTETAATIAWWEMAGVDYDYADDVTDWLAVSGPEPAADITQSGAPPTVGTQSGLPRIQAEPEKKQPERIDLLGPSPPATLEEFKKWWMEAPGIDAIGPRGRVAPHGPAHPELMVLVIDPERSDDDILLSGPQGMLLSSMLSAMGVAQENTYIASALPRHTPMPDTQSLAQGGMDRVTLHHVGLVSPQKLITFGTGILPLLCQDVSRQNTPLREINPNAQSVPILTSEGLDSLMAMPRLKARYWRRWIEWSAQIS